jgi:hypothetical protein
VCHLLDHQLPGSVFDANAYEKAEQRIKAYGTFQGGVSELSHNLNRKFDFIEKSARTKTKASRTFEDEKSDIPKTKEDKSKKARINQKDKTFLVTTVKKASKNFMSNRHSKTEMKKLKKIELNHRESEVSKPSHPQNDRSSSPGLTLEKTTKLKPDSPSKFSQQDKTIFSYGGLLKDTPENRSHISPLIHSKQSNTRQTLEQKLRLPNMQHSKLSKDSNLIAEDSWQLDTRRSHLEAHQKQPAAFSPLLYI